MNKLLSGICILLLVVAGNLISSFIVRDFLPTLAPAFLMSAQDDRFQSMSADQPMGPPIYLALDPPLVATVDDGQTIRFVQMTVEVMAREQETLDQVLAHTPVIRNNLLLLLGRKPISELTTSDGKETLRSEALDEIRSILEKMVPAQSNTTLGKLEDLYFTSFVVQ